MLTNRQFISDPVTLLSCFRWTSQPHPAFNGACRFFVVACGAAGSDALTLLKILIPLINSIKDYIGKKTIAISHSSQIRNNIGE